jgi:cytoskeletal protein RodZ
MAGSSDKVYEAGEQIEESPSYAVRKPTAFQKTKRHCQRFWWLHLIIFCIIFLIIALCLVYVAFPRIAQHGVNESTIEFTDIEFLEPTSDSIVLTQSAMLHSPSMYTPTLDPFNASLYLVTDGVFGSDPMIVIPMPRIHALHPSSSVSITNENTTIASLDQVTQYAIAVLTNKNVTTALTGRTKLHEGKLPVTTINYNSSSTYLGLNGLAGFNVTNIIMNLTAPVGQPNLKGNAFIPNPSVLTISMGNVTLALSTEKAGVVGISTIENFTLKPGNNSLPLTAVMNQTAIISSLDASGKVNVSITGTSAVYNGEHLSYYEKALASNVLALTLNVEQILADSAAAAIGA